MIKLIVGLKGSGKTKSLIELVNKTTNESDGVVICIERSDKLRYDISYRCRLINISEYNIQTAKEFYGFVAGLIASNGDITDIFIDSALKISNDNVSDFSTFVSNLKSILDNANINLTMTSSIEYDNLSDDLKKYV